ncbi:M23/M56 family metallopeptidase [Maribacter sp.]|nr:M23/M56 family metallopeptidase [Maribacter sp.]
MNNLILYLVQAASIFSVLYLLYALFLEKLTFHSSNRLVLLLLLPLSAIIPFSDNLFPTVASKIIEIPLFEQLTFEPINQQLQGIEQPLAASSFKYTTVLSTLYWVVFSIYFIRILMNAIQLLVLRHKAIIIQKKGYQIVAANVPEIFSYFKWIFIPKDTFGVYNPQILEHEKVHIQLKHSWDVMLSEIYIAFFWFNPLLYFYRKSLKSVHEFQADKGVLQKGVKTSQYMQLLMQSLEIQKPNNLYNYFNQPLLKKRVTMMTKPKSNRLSRLMYLLLLPVCTLLILAFTKPTIEENSLLHTFDVPEFKTTPPSLFPVQHATKDNITAYYGAEGKHPKVNKGIIHKGIDIKAKKGTAVLATADGLIAKAAIEGDWGNLIVITHTDGYETWYAHLSGFNTNENQEVKKGDVIGYVGNTGLSTGPHLHYEVKRHGQHLNPLDYLE